MEKEPYQDFLCRIAKHIDSLLIEDTSAIGRFRRHLQSFEEQRETHLDYMKGFQETKIDMPLEYKDPGLMLVINPNTKHLPEPKSKEEEYQ